MCDIDNNVLAFAARLGPLPLARFRESFRGGTTWSMDGTYDCMHTHAHTHMHAHTHQVVLAHFVALRVPT